MRAWDYPLSKDERIWRCFGLYEREIGSLRLDLATVAIHKDLSQTRVSMASAASAVEDPDDFGIEASSEVATAQLLAQELSSALGVHVEAGRDDDIQSTCSSTVCSDCSTLVRAAAIEKEAAIELAAALALLDSTREGLDEIAGLKTGATSCSLIDVAEEEPLFESMQSQVGPSEAPPVDQELQSVLLQPAGCRRSSKRRLEPAEASCGSVWRMVVLAATMLSARTALSGAFAPVGPPVPPCLAEAGASIAHWD